MGHVETLTSTTTLVCYWSGSNGNKRTTLPRTGVSPLEAVSCYIQDIDFCMWIVSPKEITKCVDFSVLNFDFSCETKTWSTHPVSLDCRVCRLHLCRVISPLTKGVTCCSWVATCNAWRQNRGSRAVHDLTTKVVMWLTTPCFSPHCERQVVGEARSDLSDSYIKS